MLKPPSFLRLPREHLAAIVLAISMAMFVLLGVAFHKNSTRVNQASVSRADTNHIVQSLQSFQAHYFMLESAIQHYLLSGPPSRAEAYLTTRGSLKTDLSTLTQLTHNDTAMQKRVGDLKALLDTRLSQVESWRVRIEREGPSPFLAFLASETNLKIRRENQRIINGLIREVIFTRDLDQERVENWSHKTMALLSLGALANMTILLVVFFWLDREIRRGHRAEAEVSRQAEFLRALLDNLGEGVIAADRHGKFIFWNPVAQRLVGIQPTDIPPKEWPAHFGVYLPDKKTPYPPDQLPLARALQGESVDNAPLFLRNTIHPEGILLSVSGRPVQGKVGGGVIIFRDITAEQAAVEEIRALNVSLKEHAAQVEASNRELKAFSYSVSHDLRAPLRSIDGFSQALLEDCAPELSATGKEHLSRIRAATTRMGRLIDDLLNLSRVTSTELRRTRVDLSAQARAIAQELREEAPHRHVQFIINPGLEAIGDPSLLTLALNNLIGNAYKFTGKKDGATIEFGSRQGDSGEVYFVRDNGEGFDMAFAHKLFGVFQRFHRESDFPGTGIGLATVQRIIQRHGGRVWAESTPGQGATFYFTLS